VKGLRDCFNNDLALVARREEADRRSAIRSHARRHTQAAGVSLPPEPQARASVNLAKSTEVRRKSVGRRKLQVPQPLSSLVS
jgi:hypothetical protein